uniref:NADH-ubiquinone oxidoreductase chain 4 n=1 Tax=Diplostomum ardeae TaxID=1702217 RepID=A0A6M8NXX9_9TREM|nr:NADH dehydrogenase subunit 4 [Diplostomum ardeae]QKG04347.1 NADH dehydrogenase subunit 4 [Diplostomum ardeae]
MKIKFVDWYGWFIVACILGTLYLLGFYCSMWFDLSLQLSAFSVSSFFVFDVVSFYLSLLSVFLLLVLAFSYSNTTGRSLFYIIMSVVSSLFCYCSNYVFFFWFFYEVSILSLLFLLIVESPYSERYLAGWYLSGYVMLTSLPMLLCLLYFSLVSGSLFMSEWCSNDVVFFGDLTFCIVLILAILFITKIPVPPFHIWLPIVHAEATSLVSVCLSGYIMKLGLLGVCRFCWWLVPNYIFGLGYISVCFFLSVLFFLMASWELDGKRWLAFLSLSHIIICAVCFSSCLYDSSSLLFLYSLGHGLSAGLMFIMLWWGYNLSGSRNWLILKVVLGGSLYFRVLICLGLCTVASLPPVVQFFIEVLVINSAGLLSFVLFLLFCVYLFFSSLVPLFFLGSLLSRHFCMSYDNFSGCVSFSVLLGYLIIWSFIVFVVI